MRANSNLLGKQFGRLKVVEKLPSEITPGGTVKAKWLCQCSCGICVVVRAAELHRGDTKSCGCLRVEVTRSLGLKAIRHGHAARVKSGLGRVSPTYISWRSMLDRCNNPESPDYQSYGGSGIVVCSEWASFDVFLRDMGDRPSGMSLDRFPNMRGNYEPGNCRWATPTEQSRNRGSVKLTEAQASEIRLDNRIQSEVAKDYGICQQTVSDIKRGRLWK